MFFKALKTQLHWCIQLKKLKKTVTIREMSYNGKWQIQYIGIFWYEIFIEMSNFIREAKCVAIINRLSEITISRVRVFEIKIDCSTLATLCRYVFVARYIVCKKTWIIKKLKIWKNAAPRHNVGNYWRIIFLKFLC